MAHCKASTMRYEVVQSQPICSQGVIADFSGVDIGERSGSHRTGKVEQEDYEDDSTGGTGCEAIGVNFVSTPWMIGMADIEKLLNTDVKVTK